MNTTNWYQFNDKTEYQAYMIIITGWMEIGMKKQIEQLRIFVSQLQSITKLFSKQRLPVPHLQISGNLYEYLDSADFLSNRKLFNIQKPAERNFITCFWLFHVSVVSKVVFCHFGGFPFLRLQQLWLASIYCTLIGLIYRRRADLLTSNFKTSIWKACI